MSRETINFLAWDAEERRFESEERAFAEAQRRFATGTVTIRGSQP